MAFKFSDKITDTPASSSNVLVVDALNLAFRWKHQGRTDFRFDYERTVDSLAHSYECGKIIIAADWGSSAFRKAIFPDYKQNRKDKFQDQTEVERLAFEEFIEEFEETLEMLADNGKIVLRYKSVEADDIAAYLVQEKDTFGFENIWLISSDKDWDLLIDENVSRFSTVTRKEITSDNWDDHYPGLSKDKYIIFKCLTGDTGDNIPGISGIGPKRATDIAQQYDSIFDLYDACPLNSKYKHILNLNENAEQLLINFELMDLPTYCEDAIGPENVADIKEKIIG